MHRFILDNTKEKRERETTTRGSYGILRPIMFSFLSSYLYINFFFINKIHIKTSITFFQSIYRIHHPDGRLIYNMREFEASSFAYDMSLSSFQSCPSPISLIHIYMYLSRIHNRYYYNATWTLVENTSTIPSLLNPAMFD